MTRPAASHEIAARRRARLGGCRLAPGRYRLVVDAHQPRGAVTPVVRALRIVG